MTKCIILPNHDPTNAFGAAIEKVASEIDVIKILDGRDERSVVEEASKSAIQAAILKGADQCSQ